MSAQLAKTLLLLASILGVLQGLMCIIGGCIAASDNLSEVNKDF